MSEINSKIMEGISIISSKESSDVSLFKPVYRKTNNLNTSSSNNYYTLTLLVMVPCSVVTVDGEQDSMKSAGSGIQLPLL